MDVLLFMLSHHHHRARALWCRCLCYDVSPDFRVINSPPEHDAPRAKGLSPRGYVLDEIMRAPSGPWLCGKPTGREKRPSNDRCTPRSLIPSPLPDYPSPSSSPSWAASPLLVFHAFRIGLPATSLSLLFLAVPRLLLFTHPMCSSSCCAFGSPWYAGSELSAENLIAVASATKNELPGYYPTLFAAMLEKSGGCGQFCKMSAGGKHVHTLWNSCQGVSVSSQRIMSSG